MSMDNMSQAVGSAPPASTRRFPISNLDMKKLIESCGSKCLGMKEFVQPPIKTNVLKKKRLKNMNTGLSI